MAYNPNTGIITAPVSIYDVQRCLGLSSTDLGTLCKSTLINRWSKMKPCRYDSLDVMVPADLGGVIGTDNNRIMANQTRHNPQYGTFGITWPDLLAIDSLRARDINRDFVWEPPIGKSGNYNYAYRLKDFNGYHHGAIKPFLSLSVSFTEHTFTATLTLNTNSSHDYVMQNLDFNIFEGVGFEPVLLVYRVNGSTYTREKLTRVISSQRGSKVICSDYPNNTSSLTFSDTVGYSNTNYVFVPALRAWKVYYNEDDPTMARHTDTILVDGGDLTSYCGVRMPQLANATAQSEALQPSIAIYNIDNRNGSVPSTDMEGNASGPYYAYVYVDFFGGDAGTTFTSVTLNATISGSSVINAIHLDPVTVAAGQTPRKVYVISSDVTGSCSVTATVAGSGMSDTLTQTVNIVPPNI